METRNIIESEEKAENKVYTAGEIETILGFWLMKICMQFREKCGS